MTPTPAKKKAPAKKAAARKRAPVKSDLAETDTHKANRLSDIDMAVEAAKDAAPESVLVNQLSDAPIRKVSMAAWAGIVLAVCAVITDLATQQHLPAWVVATATSLGVVITAYQAKSTLAESTGESDVEVAIEVQD